jgi:large conductance mechanosensitive channel
MSLLDEFRTFITKGNVLDLAVAFVMGAAFNALVTALVSDIVSPLIGIPGHANFTSITYAVNGSTFLVGSFVNSIITFLTIAVAVFFFIIKPVSKMESMMKPKQLAALDTKECPYCLTKIPLKATRCPSCTSHLRK